MDQSTPVDQLRDNSDLVNNILNDVNEGYDEDEHFQGGYDDDEYVPQPPRRQGRQPQFVPPPPPRSQGITMDTVMQEAKGPLIVALIVFVMSFDVVNTMLMQNISRVVTDGKLNYLGFLLKAVVSGAIFYAVTKFLLK